jgi:cob(I)alamin adenosyltransferase
MLARIQNDLFDLGADLCVPDTGEPPAFEPLRVTDAQVVRLEQEIDRLNAALDPLRSFVLPGGTPAAAALHVCRCVSRRAERLIVELAAQPGERRRRALGAGQQPLGRGRGTPPCSFPSRTTTPW